MRILMLHALAYTGVVATYVSKIYAQLSNGDFDMHLLALMVSYGILMSCAYIHCRPSSNHRHDD